MFNTIGKIFDETIEAIANGFVRIVIGILYAIDFAACTTVILIIALLLGVVVGALYQVSDFLKTFDFTTSLEEPAEIFEENCGQEVSFAEPIRLNE